MTISRIGLVGSAEDSTANQTNGSFNFSYDAGSGNFRALVAILSLANQGGTNPSGYGTPTFDGVDMTLARRELTQFLGATASCEIWTLIDPAAGSNTFAASAVGDTDSRSAILLTYQGSDGPLEIGGTTWGQTNIAGSNPTLGSVAKTAGNGYVSGIGIRNEFGGATWSVASELIDDTTGAGSGDHGYTAADYFPGSDVTDEIEATFGAASQYGIAGIELIENPIAVPLFQAQYRRRFGAGVG